MDGFKEKIDIEQEEKLEGSPPKALIQYWGFIVLFIMFLFCALGLKNAYSEGSKELSSNGGNRIITSMEGDARVTISSVDGMTTEVYAYAEVGEVLNMASSKNVDGWGYIEYFAPNGNAYRCFIPATTDTIKVGFIASAAEEFAGAGAVGGFTPCEHTVGAGEGGIWKVEFISTIGTTVTPYQTQGRQLDANEEWQVTPGGVDAPSGQNIAGQDIRWGEVIAWDVSVSDASLSTTGAIIPGRAFVTQYAGVADFPCEKNNTTPCDISIEGSGGIANHRFFIQTIEGEVFELLTNSPTASNGLGYAPYTHVLFANKRGIIDSLGNETFQSASQAAISGGSLRYQRPGLAEAQICPDCYGYKMFFNKPASDIPIDINHSVAIRTTQRENITNANGDITGANRNDLGTFPIVSASGISTSTTWLVNTIEVPEFTNVKIVGIEGTDNRVGEGMGGYISFDCHPLGAAPASVCNDIGPGGKHVDIELDLTNNGVVDVVITNVDISVGANLIAWDGTDDNNGGTPIPAGQYSAAVTIIQGNFGTVHFPTIDSEFNSNGWTLARINGPNASELSPEYTMFWDDTTIGGNKSPVDGADSSNGAHDWQFSVGNVNVIDTYALITFGEFASGFEIVNADLQVESVTTNVGTNNQTSGDTVEFTITYLNVGPSAVDGPTLFFDIDTTYFTNLQFVASSCTETILAGNTGLATQTSCGSDTNGSVVGDRYTRTGTYINPGDKIVLKVTADVKSDSDLALASLSPGQVAPSSGNIASILRPADVFDANATNPDAATPSSVQSECETDSSLDPGTDYPGGVTAFGTDCNNASASTVNVKRAEAVLGIAKKASISYNNDDTYTIAFTFNILNQSQVDVFDVQIEDDLVAPFGTYNATATVSSDLAVGEYYVTVAAAVDSITDINTLGNTTLTANTAYNGSSDKNLLTVSSPTSSSLGVGDSATLSVTIVARPDFSNGSITYENQAELQVDVEENFVVDKQYTKLSNDGVTPDVQNDSVTPIPLPKIGVAKSAEILTAVSGIPGAFDVTLKFIVRNVGNVNLQSISLIDDLTGVFGTYLSTGEVANPGEYRILTAPSATTDAGSTITVNSGFNGDSDQSIVSALPTDLLEIGDTSEITLAIRFFVDENNGSITYLNNALATAEDSDGTSVSARSANGINPTLSPPPNDPEDPTPIPYYLIQNDKELLSRAENADGTHTISYKITTTNFGNSDLFDVQVTDDLSGFGTYNGTATVSGDLATGEYYLSSSVVQNLVNTSGNSALTLETGYTGSSPNINLLQVINSATEKLAPGDKVEHIITITLKPNFGSLTSASYNNASFSYGDFATNGTSDQDVSDVSGNGFNLDGGSTPVATPIPQIALLKDVTGVVDNTDGTFTANYIVKANNIGNRDLFNVQVYDDLSNIGTHNATATAAGDLALGEYYISTPAAVDIAGLTANTSFNGASDKELLTLSTTDTLLINQEATITFSVTLRYDDAASFTYLNQAIGWGYLTDDVNNNIPARTQL